ncbi:flagellar hook-length control protein FliK [Paraburkholderia ginsengiterrae]|uniref:Flagellar hook-length control protein FliK n=1 Tax=Paraburkholderia ginsengiterrae TaxID=1462993 RepID=A0A1A9NBE7_9BURK|nr:flagellar hook-length control protein FliK [Paraburkholderia ginsengiterrae]OAJ64292.1 flagellar hook-length control protein FliK [Paraburkholderia ginsengiterrae]
MNGIDTAVASLLANRIDSLLNIAPGSAAASQTGAADVETAPATGVPVAAPAPQPSAQTALSAVALTLNAIVRSGGEATPAVLGQAPIWPAAPALDVEGGALPLFDATAAAADAAGSSASTAATASTNNPNATTTASTAATANIAAAQVPVASLAAALEQTVSDSGLFYEAHLAQWLAGQRSPADLAGEAQNKLVAAAAQLPLDWANDAGEALPANPSSRQGMASNGPQPGPQSGAPDANAAARAAPSIQTAQAARFVAGEVLASSLSDLNGQSAHASLHNAATLPGDGGGSQSSQSMAAAVHPATVPLVRQQLDLLATGQFRWTGEAWPGAKLDWTVEQDGDEWDRSGGGAASEDDHPWRTRLTLSLPTLGTVDAELTLTGTRLIARVQASPGGAARLAVQGESFRQRLAAAGIELTGLTIREIGGGAPVTGADATGAAAAAQAAASAYARSASTASAAGAATDHAASVRRTAHTGRPAASPPDDFDWDM